MHNKDTYHADKLDCPLGSKSFERPLADRSDGLDGADTVVCNQDLFDGMIAARVTHKGVD